MGKLGFFVVHCQKMLTPPKMFRQMKRAQEYCAKDRRLVWRQFEGPEGAQEFLEEA